MAGDLRYSLIVLYIRTLEQPWAEPTGAISVRILPSVCKPTEQGEEFEPTKLGCTYRSPRFHAPVHAPTTDSSRVERAVVPDKS